MTGVVVENNNDLMDEFKETFTFIDDIEAFI